MNKVMLVGRIANDLTLRTTQSGTSVLQFSLAVDRRVKKEGQKNTDFFKIVSFGKPAEIISKYLSKGRQIAVNGRLQTGQYEKDGITRYTTDIILEEFDFIGSKKDGQSSPQEIADAFGVPLTNGGLGDDDFTLLADDNDVPF